GTMGRTPLTAFARSLLDDANAEAMLGTLGFSQFMRERVGSNSFFGWGLDNANNNIHNDNADTLRTNGVYRALASTVGGPGAGVWQVLHMGQASGYAVQVAFPMEPTSSRGPRLRNLTANTWLEWRPLSDECSVNANGTFIRTQSGL